MESLFLQQIANGLIVGSIYCLIAIGLTMIFGVMNLSNFAHGDFSMLGAYFAIYTTAYLSGWFGWISSMFIAAIGVGIIGYFVERTMFRPLMKRPTDIDVIMLSIALFIILENGAQLIFGATPQMVVDPFQSASINLFLFQTSYIRIFSFVLAILIIIALQVFLTKTKVGVGIRAASQNSKASMLMGINVSFIYSLTFIIGSALAGLGGVLYGTIFAVYPTMGAMPTLKAFVITIMGGMGSIRGAIVGGIILGVAETLGGSYLSMQYKNSIGFIILILVLLTIPQGLFGRGKRHA
ncbi:MAG TPA: branched-chain amino acid ABC transporter permease [Deltaproteobacteria bacterium]|nr:branched-chain amino acid ABC transporter permease [Deltaproteobacteria bacterium]HPR55236.1 branched-chain amino acid ABC transporter permease [Deltaproteobacteria bacterium]HXK46873.1 branched-chain amino acid ABC transporter permease [Deltaproteobacteria bacterium]